MNFDQQTSLSKRKYWCSNNCLHFYKAQCGIDCATAAAPLVYLKTCFNGATTISLATLSRGTLGLNTLGKMGLIATLNIRDKMTHRTLSIECHYAKCCYTYCRGTVLQCTFYNLKYLVNSLRRDSLKFVQTS